MTPQFVDFNFDGLQDMVVGTFEGTAFWVPGSAGGFQEFQRIKDAQGRPVLIADFWNYEEKKWDEADRSPEGQENPSHHCTSVVAVDWDGDKDLDLLLGAYRAGALYLQLNDGKPGAPSYTGVNYPVKAGGSDLIVPGGMASVRKVDWNDDGLFDLVCGGAKGGVYLYQNEGKLGAPEFAPPQSLVEPAGDDPAEIDNGLPTSPQTGFHIDVVDFDGDEDLDLLVGGYSAWNPQQRELTPEQRIKVAELEKEIAQLQAKFSTIRRDLQATVDKSDPQALRAAFKKFRESGDYQELRKRQLEAMAELKKLKPTRQRKAFVWLYRRKA